MGFIGKMLNLQLELFLLILIGIYFRKKGIIDQKTRKALSDMLIDVILPCSIIRSFISGVSISEELFRNCVAAVAISACIQAFAIFAGKYIFWRYKKEKKSVVIYGLICSNSSFVGLPIAEALYGSIAVLFTSIFQLPIRLTMWTSGLMLFTSVDKKNAIKQVMVHPCIVSIFIGFALMLLPITLPPFLFETISALSRAVIPFSMIVIGAILADADIKGLFGADVLYYAFVRLLAYPILIYFLLKLFPVDPLIRSICVIMTGMPAGSTTSILADKYGCDAEFAAQIVFVSTFLSIFTIPLLGLLL